jgi:MoaA/NifB/PqqE/SkfB family radical SAM enzyme
MNQSGNSAIHACLREKKNLFLHTCGLLRVNTATFAITTDCNHQCLICDFGKKNFQKPTELSVAAIEKVLDHAICKKVAYIGITGGEPFLYPALIDLRNRLFEKIPSARVTLSSNGTMTDEILNYVSQTNKMNQTSLELSLLGVSTHDHISGSKNAFARMKKTLDALRVHAADTALRIKFTITPGNYHELFDVIGFCERYRVPLLLKVVENVVAYQNMISYERNHDNAAFIFSPPEKDEIAHILERGITSSILYNKEHVRLLLRWFKNEPIKRFCFANQKSLFVAQNQKVYFCRMFQPIATINTLPDMSVKDVYKNQKTLDPALCKSCVSIFRSVL